MSHRDSSYYGTCELLTDFDDMLATYNNWPRQMKLLPIFLVYCGFVYTDCGDVIQCLSCKKAVCHWGDWDDPLQVHESLSPACPYIVANKQTLIATLSQRRRFREETITHGCTPFEPTSDQPAIRAPLPEQIWSLQRQAFITTI